MISEGDSLHHIKLHLTLIMRQTYSKLTAYLRQTEQYNCGIVALNTIVRHHGVSDRYQKIRNLVGINEKITNLLALKNAAESMGFSAKGMKGSYNSLYNIPFPAIAHMTAVDNLGHFVVLHQWSPKAVVISDCNEGIRSLSQNEFCLCWTGYLLVIAFCEDKQ